MTAYYNEIDGQKAAWLRELISHDLIAPGDVDERSIHDVRPDDLRGHTQCHFFAGIGIWSYALRLAGWPDDREVWTGSCPCQPFSAAGKGAAFDDERHLWPVWFPLIEARRPLVCFGEQVSSIDGLAWFDVVHPDLDRADYTVGVLDTCAAGVGAPHRRQRLYWVADTAEQRHDRRRTGEARGWQGELERLCDAGGLAHGDGERCDRESVCVCQRGPQQASTETPRRGDAFAVENSDRLQPEQSPRKRPGADRSGGGWSCGEPSGSSASDRMENSLRPEWWAHQRERGGLGQAPGRDESADRAGERGEVERVALTIGGRFDSRGTSNSGREGRGAFAEQRGPVNGFWRAADWVLTRPQRVGDRPGLRPVERSAFPLAHGAAARVGRLRGYGDGIVAWQAAAFVRAYMELALSPATRGGA